MIVNDELEKMWKEAVLVYLSYYPSICLESETTDDRRNDNHYLTWDT